MNVNIGSSSSSSSSAGIQTDISHNLQIWLHTSNSEDRKNYQTAIEKIEACYKDNADELDLSGLKLKTLPECLSKLINVRTINLSKNNLTELPTFICKLFNLDFLHLGDNKIVDLPDEIGDLIHLKELNVRNNKLTSLPYTIGNLFKLERLYLSKNELREVPESLKYASNLSELNLRSNHLKSLPDIFDSFPFLQDLNIGDNSELYLLPSSLENHPLTSEFPRQERLIQKLDIWVEEGNALNRDSRKKIKDSIIQVYTNKLPTLILRNEDIQGIVDVIGKCESLVELDLQKTGLKGFPNGILNLTNLRKLDISNNEIRIPSNIGKLKNITHLNLSLGKITQVPAEIGELTQLQELNLGNNPLRVFPSSVSRLQNLKILSLNGCKLKSLLINAVLHVESLNLLGNEITDFPAQAVAQFPNLRQLNIAFNQITTLPNSIGNLNLSFLSIANNRLASLPAQIGAMGNLEILDISLNPIVNLPHSIRNCVSLRQLSLDNTQISHIEKQEILETCRRGSFMNEYIDGFVRAPTELLDLSFFSKYISAVQFQYIKSQLEEKIFSRPEIASQIRECRIHPSIRKDVLRFVGFTNMTELRQLSIA